MPPMSTDNEPRENFSTSALPLYDGDTVKVRVGSTGREFTLPKDLICKQSWYFESLLSRNPKEGQEQSAPMQEIDLCRIQYLEDVVSERSFSSLVQWMYYGRVDIDKTIPPNGEISNLIEFARLADIFGVNGMERETAMHIKTLIMENQTPPPRHPYILTGMRDPDTNTAYITSENLVSASLLPDGHLVRYILAAASVEGYLRHWNHQYKFQKETNEIPKFAFDLLTLVKLTLRNVGELDNKIFLKDPITGNDLLLHDLRTV